MSRCRPNSSARVTRNNSFKFYIRMMSYIVSGRTSAALMGKAYGPTGASRIARDRNEEEQSRSRDLRCLRPTLGA